MCRKKWSLTPKMKCVTAANIHTMSHIVDYCHPLTKYDGSPQRLHMHCRRGWRRWDCEDHQQRKETSQ